MNTYKIGEWAFLNVSTGIGAIFGFIQQDPISTVLTWLALAGMVAFNYYRTLLKKQELIAKKRENEAGQPK